MSVSTLSQTLRDLEARLDLRLINRTVSFQIGSDATRNQDDLTRGYTWLGEQGSGWAPVYGGDYRGKERDTWWAVRDMPAQNNFPPFVRLVLLHYSNQPYCLLCWHH